MDPQFDSIDSNAPAPLVFETELESESPSDSSTNLKSDKQQGKVKGTEQKLSLSQYEESDQKGETTPTNGPELPSIENVPDPSETSHVNAEVIIHEVNASPKTSTPVRQVSMTVRTDSVNCSPVHLAGTPTQGALRSRNSSSLLSKETRVKFLDPREITVPVLGYEIMEQRARFTVFKLHVQRGRSDNWFVFRRYSDFTQLQRKLRILFPRFHFALPPKRWFRDNFEQDFLNNRVHGLQAFINDLICHQEVCNSIPIQQFFCFEDPPGAHDSIEESRAYCAELENTVYGFKNELREKDSELELMRDELNLYKSQVEMLTRALREKNSNGAKNTTDLSTKVPSPANSLAECDIMTSHAEHSLSVSLNTGSQIHSAIDPADVQLGVSVQSLKDELAAATNYESYYTEKQK